MKDVALDGSPHQHHADGTNGALLHPAKADMRRPRSWFGFDPIADIRPLSFVGIKLLAYRARGSVSAEAFLMSFQSLLTLNSGFPPTAAQLNRD
jgi:hypothetical protein